MYGNYCGPYWSDGKIQTSVSTGKPSIDSIDEHCRIHDAKYANNDNLTTADISFAKAQILEFSPLAALMGAAVGLQGAVRSLFDDVTDTSGINFNVLRGIFGPENEILNPTELSPPNEMAKPKQQAKQSKPIMIPRRGAANGSKTKLTPLAIPSRQSVADSASFAPTSISIGTSNAKPTFKQLRNGNTTVTHREYVGLMTCYSSFTCSAIPLNPGVASTFCWLSSVARNYDKYRFRRLRFEYIPSCSSATAGRVCLAFNYNSGDAKPQTKGELFSIIPNQEVNAWSPCAINVDCNGPNELYTRQFIVPDQDVKTFDMGQFLIASNSGTGAVSGELYVSYDVELLRPHPSPVDVTQLYSTSSSITDLLPIASTTSIGSGLMSKAISSSYVARLNASGAYYVRIRLIGTDLTAVSGSFTGCTATDIADPAEFIVNVAGNVCIKEYMWNVALTDPNIPGNWAITVTGTTVSKCLITVVRLEPDILYQLVV